MKLMQGAILFMMILFFMMSMPGIGIEASPLSVPDPLERAKQATVGVLRHAADSSHHSTQSQFAIRGSGFHIGDGYIVTARHAVERREGSKAKIPEYISIITSQLTEYSAELIGVNGFLDLALYRIHFKQAESTLPFFSFGEDESRQGDEVFTIGYPLGWGPALAFGRLGNLRTFLPTAQTRLMQVDLSACSGNSGGGLFNTQGDVIGLVHAIIQSETKENERRCSRFAFAVPGVMVQKIVEELQAGKSFSFPKLGIRMTVVKVAQQWRVAVAKAKGPARDAGIHKHDVLLSINEQPITSASQLKSYLIEHTVPGQIIELRVLRGDSEKILKVTLGSV